MRISLSAVRHALLDSQLLGRSCGMFRGCSRVIVSTTDLPKNTLRWPSASPKRKGEPPWQIQRKSSRSSAELWLATGLLFIVVGLLASRHAAAPADDLGRDGFSRHSHSSGRRRMDPSQRASRQP